jgi:hypothetical protein
VEEELEQRSNVVTRRCRGCSHTQSSPTRGHPDSNLHIVIVDQHSSNHSSTFMESICTGMERCACGARVARALEFGLEEATARVSHGGV